MSKTKKQLIREIDIYCDKIKGCAKQMGDEFTDNPSIILLAEQIGHYHSAIKDVKTELNWLKARRDNLKGEQQ